MASGAGTSSEEKAVAPPPDAAPPGVEPKELPLWIPILSAVAVVTLLTSAYALLKIYAPSLADVVLGGNPATTAVGIGVIGALCAVIPMILKSGHLPKVREALGKLVDLLFQCRRAALILAPVALAVGLGTWSHWQSSGGTPILRIQPAHDLFYYLADGNQAAKPPWRTVEIRVEVREGAGEQRLYPRDGRAIDIGASGSVLRWRAARESEGPEPKALTFLGTPRLRPDDLVSVRVLCRRSGAELLRARVPVAEEPYLLEPEDGDDFNKRMEACDPI
jgi:hypothetical protein